MDLKINIDTDRIQKEMQTALTQRMIWVVQEETKSAFGTKVTRCSNGQVICEKAPGLRAIEDMIANKFISPEFTQEMNAYFEENWKRIFEECMRTALQHKANAVVFSKVKAVPESER